MHTHLPCLSCSVQIFHRQPKEKHCGLMNSMAHFARRLLLTSAVGHSALEREEWRKGWRKRGFVEVSSSELLFRASEKGKLRDMGMLLSRVGAPHSVDCRKSSN